MRGITTNRFKRHLQKEKKVSVYKGAELVGDYLSLSHASRALGVAMNTIRIHMRDGSPSSHGYTFVESCKDPNKIKANAKFCLTQDGPVAIFDKYTDQYIASYKNVSQFASAENRPIETVYGWLTGKRCTDPDFYYKFERDCSEEELNNKYTI